MRVVKRNRYYCEFCKKAGGSGGHIKRHEDSCTKNPNRVCRVCVMLEALQVPISDLKSHLPQLRVVDFDTSPIDITALREAAHNCPACIMAALRQSGIPVPLAQGFNFTEEMKAIWADINQANFKAGYAPEY